MEWYDIKRYGGCYQISDSHKIRSISRTVVDKIGRPLKFHGKYLTVKISKSGYFFVRLSIKDKSKREFIHRLIAEVKINNLSNLPFINHIDGNKLNNSIENLEWCTHAQNMAHAFRTNLVPRVVGENQARSKLKNNEVREIFASKLVLRKLAEIYNVDHKTIRAVKKGITWNHITGMPITKKYKHY